MKRIIRIVRRKHRRTLANIARLEREVGIDVDASDREIRTNYAQIHRRAMYDVLLWGQRE